MASWKSVTAAADYVTRRLPRSRPSHRRRPDHGGRDGCRRHPRPATHGERTIERCGHEAGQGNEESCGNGGVVESVEIQERDFPSSHRSLEISQKPRDSHIPTAPPTRRWKSGKTKAGFPLFHRLLLGRINKPKQQTASARKKRTLLSRYRIINATLRELAQLGVPKRTLFPDLAGLAEFVRWKHLHEVNGNSLRPSNERPPN